MFNVGDEVIVKDEFWYCEPHHDLGYNEDMYEYAGKTHVIVTVNFKNKTHWYELDGNDWIWDENWLEPVETGHYKDICAEEVDLLFMGD